MPTFTYEYRRLYAKVRETVVVVSAFGEDQEKARLDVVGHLLREGRHLGDVLDPDNMKVRYTSVLELVEVSE